MVTLDQRERIQGEFKIPVDSLSPRTYWILSIDAESIMPTDEELRQLQSYCEFSASKTYNDNFVKVILERDLPWVSGHNTIIFRKGNWGEKCGDDTWFYRKSSWREGPLFVPFTLEEDYRTYTLVEVMDHYEHLVPEKWATWKLEHAEIFPVSQEKEECMSRIFVVTAPTVTEGDGGPNEISFKFMFDAGAYLGIHDAHLVKAPYGMIKAIEDNTGKSDTRWQIALGEEGRCVLSSSVDPSDEGDLKMLFENIPDCIILMQRDLFDRFEEACKDFGHELMVCHFEGPLSAA